MKTQSFPLHQVDAFTDRVFGGNPAAICPMQDWLPDELLQLIAAENNLSETAYIRQTGQNHYAIRWFTPNGEVDLCGHATLASAHLLFEKDHISGNTVTFSSKSGSLSVSKGPSGRLTMDFPIQPYEVCEMPPELKQGLGIQPHAVFSSMDYLVVLPCQDDVVNVRPDMKALSELSLRGVIITAPGKDCDFVSRFFAPKYGIPEDPVTGSAHCTLAPYWSQQLGKIKLSARQLSARGGALSCELKGNRVLLTGTAVTYLSGTIHVPSSKEG